MEIKTTSRDKAGSPVSPMLAMLAVPRVGGYDIPGRYSSELQMWVVDTECGEVPIISYRHNIQEKITKTMVQQESDDQSIPIFLDSVTKTSFQLERDDNHYDGSFMLELSTKTEAQIERDDDHYINSFMSNFAARAEI